MNTEQGPLNRATALRATAGLGLLLALILVPFLLFEDPLARLSASLVDAGRPRWLIATAVAGLLAADVLLPIPSSLVSTASGVLLGWAAGAVASWIGMTAGCAVAFWLGRSAGRSGARRLVGDAGLAGAERMTARFGRAAIVLSRPVPVLAEASAVLAGAFGMPFRIFLPLSALSNAGVALVYAVVGASVTDGVSFVLAFVGAMALSGIGLLAARIWTRSGRAAAADSDLGPG